MGRRARDETARRETRNGAWLGRDYATLDGDNATRIGRARRPARETRVWSVTWRRVRATGDGGGDDERVHSFQDCLSEVVNNYARLCGGLCAARRRVTGDDVTQTRAVDVFSRGVDWRIRHRPWVDRDGVARGGVLRDEARLRLRALRIILSRCDVSCAI